MSIAVVSAGTFQYRSTSGEALLAPGALLLGNEGACFECGHEHGVGDRCLSFSFTGEYLERILAAVPGTRQMGFQRPHLPPMPSLMPVIAAAEAARADGDHCSFEELTLSLAGAVTAALTDGKRSVRSPSRRDEARVSEALRRIEAHADEPIALADLAHGAAMSPYHFLRTFRQVVGMTPYQYILRTRLHRAAVRLRQSQDAISTIAYDAGFNDLSTFNHRFRHIMGASPSAYRMGHSG